MPAPQDNSLEGRLAELERRLRSLETGNLLERASVVDASGEYVELSSLAFGQASAVEPLTAQFTVNSPAWSYGAPTLDVYVTGGRLRVDLAAHLLAYGVNLRMAMGYRLLGPGDEEGGDLDTVAQAPADSRALFVISNGETIATQVSSGIADLATGLARGWYRVQCAYQLSGETQPAGQTSGAALNRRLFATPL